MPTESERVRQHVRKLKAAPIHRFETRVGVKAPRKQGVYLIYGPRGRVLHVGRTTRAKNGLRQRIKNHIDGRSSFVKQYLQHDRERLFRGFGYSWIDIPRDRMRALVEHYAVGHLCPVHLGTHAAKDES